MKDNINFLFPVSEKDKYLGPRFFVAMMVVFFLVVAGAFAFSLHIFSSIGSEREEIEKLRLLKDFNEKQMAAISSDFEKAQEIDLKFQALKRLIELSNKVENKQYPLGNILEDLSLSIPQGVFLTLLRIEPVRKTPARPGKKKDLTEAHAKLKISGIAASSDMADKFISSLEELPYLVNPIWNQISIGESDRRLFEFEIVSDISFRRKG